MSAIINSTLCDIRLDTYDTNKEKTEAIFEKQLDLNQLI